MTPIPTPCLVLALAVLMAGCSGTTGDVPASWLAIIEAEAATPPPAPAECVTKGDPVWSELPDRDVHADEAARHARINKNRFRELAGRRRVCAAGLAAAQPKKETSNGR